MIEIDNIENVDFSNCGGVLDLIPISEQRGMVHRSVCRGNIIKNTVQGWLGRYFLD